MTTQNNIAAKDLFITVFNWDTEKEQVLKIGVEWCMNERLDGYWMGTEQEQKSNIEHYLNSVANISHETIFELISWEIK